MFLYICVTVLTVILAYMCGYTKKYASVPGNCVYNRADLFGRVCIVSIFVVLFALSACRLNVGNDYGTYVEFMHRLYTDKYIPDAGVPTEWGFNLLARFIYGISGYENYILVFAIYAFVTVFLFLLAIWEQSEDFALSFVLFMFFGYYFQSFSTVRYYLALAIALYGMKLVNERRWISFIAIVILGSGFHKSLLVIIPLYFIASITWKKWHIIAGSLICVSCLFLQDLYLKILVKVYPSYEGTEYLEGSGLSWINIIRCVLVLALAVYCYKTAVKDDKAGMFFFKLNICAIAVYVFGSFLPIVSRIGYYLTVSHILFVPMLISRIENRKIRKVIYAVLILLALMYFAVYLRKAYDDGVLVLPYKSIFFDEMVDTLSDVT
ncbi:MAG: EpsG family protein [Lachnospiraceae bacterium]|nr:EpsG family protein [Lachnospiraceae bacterium]